MKQFFTILLCLMMCFGFTLTAFAGGPINTEDILADENTDLFAPLVELPSGLSVGTVYNIKSMDDSVSGSFMLNVNGGGDYNGAKINMWQEDGSVEQTFRLVSSSNYYKLKAVCASGRFLDLYRNNGKIEDGCTVDIWDGSDDMTQQLVIVGNSTFGYTIFLTGSSSLVLTATGMYNGAGVEFQKLTGDKNQRWNFVSTDDIPNLPENPDSKAQNKSLWCWAAAAKMVAEHNSGGLNPAISTSAQRLDNELGVHKDYYSMDSSGYLTVDGVQHAIVTKIKGSDMNKDGSDTDKENALQFASANEMNVKTIGSINRMLTGIEIEDIQNELLKGNYFIGNVCDSSNQNIHSVVIMSYSSSDKTYDVFDPWNGSVKPVNGDNLFQDYKYSYMDNHFGSIKWVQYCN